jgi:hypothetical protein
MAIKERPEHSHGIDQPPHEADDQEEQPSEAAKDAKDPFHDPNFRDQSQGPSHPRDDSGRKKDES